MTVIYECEVKQHGYFYKPECPVCKNKASVCNHRTIFKILLNPLLRLFGIHIISIFSENNEFVSYGIKKINDLNAKQGCKI